MSNNNLELYNSWSEPPASALKNIAGGRLRGMTDINPQWRLRALTEAFGPVGAGWRYTIDRLWTEPTGGETIAVFAMVSLSVRYEGEWSLPIPGIGGNQLVTVERDGVHVNDECYKMAVTDALSVACKALGIGAAVYEGRWDGSKYRDPDGGKQAARPAAGATATRDDARRINNAAVAAGLAPGRVIAMLRDEPFCCTRLSQLLRVHVNTLIGRIAHAAGQTQATTEISGGTPSGEKETSAKEQKR